MKIKTVSALSISTLSAALLIACGGGGGETSTGSNGSSGGGAGGGSSPPTFAASCPQAISGAYRAVNNRGNYTEVTTDWVANTITNPGGVDTFTPNGCEFTATTTASINKVVFGASGLAIYASADLATPSESEVGVVIPKQTLTISDVAGSVLNVMRHEEWTDTSVSPSVQRSTNTYGTVKWAADGTGRFCDTQDWTATCTGGSTPTLTTRSDGGLDVGSSGIVIYGYRDPNGKLVVVGQAIETPTQHGLLVIMSTQPTANMVQLSSPVTSTIVQRQYPNPLLSNSAPIIYYGTNSNDLINSTSTVTNLATGVPPTPATTTSVWQLDTPLKGMRHRNAVAATPTTPAQAEAWALSTEVGLGMTTRVNAATTSNWITLTIH